jgi:hypothetical protein
MDRGEFLHRSFPGVDLLFGSLYMEAKRKAIHIVISRQEHKGEYGAPTELKAFMSCFLVIYRPDGAGISAR